MGVRPLQDGFWSDFCTRLRGLSPLPTPLFYGIFQRPALRNPWAVFAPGDFFERSARERAIVLDESLEEWADAQGYAPGRCSWELLTELPEGLEEEELPGWGESYQGNGQYGYQGR